MDRRHCDICDSAKDIKRETLLTGAQTDAAGSTESVGETIDWCTVCKLRIIDSFLGTRFKTHAEVYSMNQELITIIKRIRGKVNESNRT